MIVREKSGSGTKRCRFGLGKGHQVLAPADQCATKPISERGRVFYYPPPGLGVTNFDLPSLYIAEDQRVHCDPSDVICETSGFK